MHPIRWNDFVTDRAVADSTNLPSILSTIAARRHSIFGNIRRLADGWDGWNRPSVNQYPNRAGVDSGLTTGLLPTTGHHGGRYVPQPVTRISE